MQQAQQVNNQAFAKYKAFEKTFEQPVSSDGDSPDTKHYIWYAGEDLPFQESVGGFVFRGEVVPVLPFPKWAPIDDVPGELRERVRPIRDREGNAVDPTEALYFIDPHPIFKAMKDAYGGWGLTELRALKNWELDDVMALNIDRTFFPNGCPALFDDIEKEINLALERLRGDENYDTYAAIARDMKLSLTSSRAADMAYCDEVEQNIEMGKTKPGYQNTYDERALRALYRIQRERKDHAMNQMAGRQNAIVDALPDLIKGLSTNTLAPADLATVVAEAVARVMAAQKAVVETPDSAPVAEVPAAPQLELRRGPGRPPAKPAEG